MACATGCNRVGQVVCSAEAGRERGRADQQHQCILIKDCVQEVPSSCGSYIVYKDGHESTAWQQADFDDSAWPTALDGGDNGVPPWGLRSDISGEAHWIWTHDNDEHDKVYCRFVSNHIDIHCPAAAARYLRDYPDLHQYPELDAFDHYNANEGGKAEGRIWHSNDDGAFSICRALHLANLESITIAGELCNEDGTNKGSHCEIIHTSDQYDYQFMSEELHDDKAITFAVRAHNDAHIGFFERNDAGGDAGDTSGASHGAQYEIVLSGWDGTQSVIREAAQGENHATLDTTGIIDENDSRQFWASAANGVIRLGRGNVVGFNVLLQWQDPDAVLDLHWAAVATGWGSDGDWTVCIPESCSGWHDAMEAKESGNVSIDLIDPNSDSVFTGTGVVNFLGDETGCGEDGSSRCYSRNVNSDESVTWTLYGCRAGLYDLGWSKTVMLSPFCRAGRLANPRSTVLQPTRSRRATGSSTSTSTAAPRRCSPSPRTTATWPTPRASAARRNAAATWASSLWAGSTWSKA